MFSLEKKSFSEFSMMSWLSYANTQANIHDKLPVSRPNHFVMISINIIMDESVCLTFYIFI